METKELKINIPEGYEIDKEKSTFENIVFKKIEKKLTYEDIVNKILKNKNDCFIIQHNNKEFVQRTTTYAYSKSQVEWLIALIQLQNVATYLNDGWKPDCVSMHQTKFFITHFNPSKVLVVCYENHYISSHIYFKSEELALQAIEILGEETVKTALGVYKDC